MKVLIVEKNKIIKQLKEYVQNLERVVDDQSKQLIDSEKFAAIGRMEQGLLHNIANPLSGITVLTECIMNNIDTQIRDLKFEGKIDVVDFETFLATMFDQLNTIKKSSDNIKIIIKNLMKKSRSEQILDRESINISDLINQELEFLKADLVFKNDIEKSIELDRNIPELMLVYSDFSQTFNNLVRNAVDAMYETKEKFLTIKTWDDEDKVYIRVQDTGKGIPEDVLANIFEPFYTTKPKEGSQKEGEPIGTGLGLYECYKMMRFYNAFLTVQSEVSQGTVFTIIIPKKGNLAD